jgi:hypothetical protein
MRHEPESLNRYYKLQIPTTPATILLANETPGLHLLFMRKMNE